MKSSVLLKLLSFMVLVVFLILVSGYIWTKSYIRGEDFQGIVTRKISEKVGGAVSVAPTEWDGWRLENDQVQITAAKWFQDLEANRLSLELDSRGLFERVWRISDLSISELSLKLLSSTQKVDEESAAQPLSEDELRNSKHVSLLWLPRKLELDSVTIDNVKGLYAGEQLGVTWNEMALLMEREGSDYLYEVPRGEVSFDAYPELTWRVTSFQGRFKPEVVFLNEAQLTSDGAVIDLTGEKDFSGAGYLQGELRDLPVERLVPEDWKKKFGGRLQSSFTASFDADVTAKGAAHVKQATITALPALDIIANKTGVQKFRSIEFDACQADYTLENEVIRLKNVILESVDFLKITGNYEHSAGSSYGQFEVGLAAEVVEKLPAGTGSIFSTDKEGYLWTTVNVSYKDRAWKEDLTARMVGAAMRSLFEGAGSTASDALETLQDSAQEVIEAQKPAQIIEAGQELIKRGAESLFDLLD